MLSFHTEMAIEHNRVCFGGFEVDRQARELHKHGLRIRLEDQPFEVLATLLERPGEVVTRSELQARIWPEGTFVDFDKGLTKAVNKIRAALSDSAATPRYIETLARRGYRFIAPVNVVADPAPGLGPDGGAPAPAEPPRRAPLKRRWIAVAVAGAVFVIAAVLVALNAGGLRDRLLTALALRSAGIPRIESIAVLPLQNLSRDPEQEYFADGLTDMLIGDLGQMGTLRVISHTSVMQYKGTKKSLPEIARELNVDAAVEGTVLRAGGRIRISTQLLLARTDTHLWSGVYERDFQDVIKLERQAALAMAHEITGRLTAAQATRLAHGRTINPQAYDAYLRGRYLWNQRTESVAAAVGYFEQALRADPNFALAYSGLADSYSVSWWSQADPPRAVKYARNAVALDPDLAEAHASLGIACAYSGQFAEAGQELRRAVELNPNYAMAHHWLAIYLDYFGRFEEALGEHDRARQLDPFSLPVNTAPMYALVGLRQYDRAIEQCETIDGVDPKHALAHFWLTRIYWLQGRVPEALAEARIYAAARNAPARLRDVDEIAATYQRSGLRATQVLAAKLEAGGYNKGLYPPLDISYRYGLTGDANKVFEWLDATCRDNPVECYTIRGAPEFDFVRSNPRFHALLHRLGLEQ